MSTGTDSKLFEEFDGLDPVEGSNEAGTGTVTYPRPPKTGDDDDGGMEPQDGPFKPGSEPVVAH